MLKTQSNTQRGPLNFAMAADLTGLDGRLLKLTHNGDGLTQVALPAAVNDITLFVLDDAGVGKAIPLDPAQNTRVRAKGAGNAGDVLVLSDPAAAAGAHAGKAEAIGATAGVYFSPGIAEEKFVDGQLVLIRPFPRLVTVEAQA